MKNLLLIDANALIHRCFHALPAFTNKDSQPSGALYGLSSILIKLFKDNEINTNAHRDNHQANLFSQPSELDSRFRENDNTLDSRWSLPRRELALLRGGNDNALDFRLRGNDMPPKYYVAAFFDRPEPTFRKKIYSDYKIHRPPAPDELKSQIIEAHNLFTAFGIKTFEAPGFEADDLIGTAAEKFKKEPDLKIIILTGDADALQLVENEKIVVETFKKGISETMIYNEKEVKNRYGILPAQLPDYKGLVGDPSDNIKGVEGIGPKTATAIIQKFESIEKFLEHKKEEKDEKNYLRIFEQKKSALLSKELATIRRNAPLEIKNLEELKYNGWNQENLIAYLEKFGFKSLIKRI